MLVLRFLLIALTFGLLGAQSSAQSLVHLWSFDGNFDDSSPNLNTGSAIGTPTFVTGRFGQAVSLDATPDGGTTPGDGVEAAFAGGLPVLTTDSWSMNVWANFAADDAPGALEYLAGFGVSSNFAGGAEGQARGLLNFGTGFYFWGANGGGITADVDSGIPYDADGQWHMYTINHDASSSTTSMYRDGTFVTSASSTLVDTSNQVQVGNPSFWNQNFSGSLDEFSIYDNVLSEAQIGGLFFNNDPNDPVEFNPDLTVNRDTGDIILTNDSNFDIDVLGYTIRSAVGGLNPSAFSTIAGRFDAPPAGDGSIDSNDTWDVITDTAEMFSVEFSEGAPGTDGGTIEIGKVVNFGAGSWVPSPAEDVAIDLLLNDGQGTIQTIIASFVGNGDEPFEFGDLDTDGSIGISDWAVFQAATEIDLAGTTGVEAYLAGDLDGDQDKDIFDLDIFIETYEAANGIGSFAQIAGNPVPEPSSLILVAAACLGGVMIRKRRLPTGRVLTILLIACTVAISVSRSQAQSLVHQWSFDNNLNDTSGSGNDGTLTGGDGTAEYIAGRFGQAYDLNSAEGVVNSAASNLPLLGNNSATMGTTDTWTMNVWLNLASTPQDLSYFAGFGNHDDFTGAPEHGQSRGLIDFGAGYYFWGCNCDGTQPNPDIDSGAAYIADNDWHMYSVVNDGTNISMYTDATLVFSSPNNLVDSTFTEVAVGNPSVWNTAARAGVDEFSIYDGVLDGTQILGLFQSNDPFAAAFLRLEVDRGTGEVKIINDSATGSVSLNSYQISSPGSDLRLNEWDDLAGNAGFDPATSTGAGDGWEQDASSGTTQILESYLLGDGTFAGAQEISLGNIFTPGGEETLEFLYRNDQGVIVDISQVDYVGAITTLPGDFNGDLEVDIEDYNVWRDNLGAATDGAINDSGDGVNGVDEQDYLVWRNAFGNSALPAALEGPNNAVPEASTAALLLSCVCSLSAVSRFRRRQR